MEKLSIVVPCFNEQETIPLFYPAVQKVLAKMPKVTPEYWFVDDGSNLVTKINRETVVNTVVI